MDVATVIRDHGNIATRRQILAAGLPAGSIATAMRRAEVFRVRRGWFATPDATFEQRVAVAFGGRLGGLSAARSYGMWTIPDGGVHVSWAADGNVAVGGRHWRFPDARRVGEARIIPYWNRDDAATSSDRWRESPEQALRQVLLREETSAALAVADSALHLGVVDDRSIDRVFARLPERLHPYRAMVDGIPDSGLESIVRFRLRARGLPFLIHPVIAGMEVDFLVGDSLVIETDGAAFHSTEEAFERDRARDNRLAALGFTVIRWSFDQIVNQPDLCDARLNRQLALRDHLRPVSAFVGR